MTKRPLVAGLCLALVCWGCEPASEEPPPPVKVPVTSEVVSAGPFQARLLLLGTVEPSQRLEVRTAEAGTLRFAARFEGGLRSGVRVEAGEHLFDLENQDITLHASEAELEARAAEAELERARRGVEGGFLPEMELKNREIQMDLATERLSNARAKKRRLRHTAPASGLLTVEASLPSGVEVAAGRVLASLAVDGQPIVETWAAASHLASLEVGLPVECLRPSSRELLGRGHIRELAHGVDAMGTARLVVVIDEDLAMPRPGEGVEVEVLLPERQAVLTVPEEALLIDSGISRSFVLTPSGADYQAERRLVTTGQRSGARVEIVYGLTEGERVAVRGAEFLSEGLLAVEARGLGR